MEKLSLFSWFHFVAKEKSGRNCKSAQHKQMPDCCAALRGQK
jgi:hypothetical protein